jgi:hypothetical protein
MIAVAVVQGQKGIGPILPVVDLDPNLL